MSVYTRDGANFEAELRADAEQIHRKIVRFTFRRRPDWTGVQMKVSFRMTYKIGGEIIQFEQYLGLEWPGMPIKEHEKIRKRADAIYDKMLGIASSLSLDVRGASYE